MTDDARSPFSARPGTGRHSPTPSSSSIAWWSTASGLCTMFVATLVIVICPAIHTTAPAHLFSSVAKTPLPASAIEQVSELTARLVDQRTRPALPRPLDLAGASGAGGQASRPAPTVSAHIFGQQLDAHDSASHESVTGDAVAFSASDAGGRGGIGAATLSGAGSSGASSAMIAGRSGLAGHAGFTVARHTTATGTIHTSVQPLDRPG